MNKQNNPSSHEFDDGFPSFHEDIDQAKNSSDKSPGFEPMGEWRIQKLTPAEAKALVAKIERLKRSNK
jgi:hypothetical protein